MTKPPRLLVRGIALLVATIAFQACGSNGPTGTPGTTEAGLRHFDDETMAFDYPGGWGAARFDVVSSFSTVLVYLSTAPLSDPCDRTANSIACTRSAVSVLGRDGVLVEWSRQSFPGWTFDPTRGRPLLVGGRRATVEQMDAAGDPCGTIGGERELVVTIDDPVPDMNWTGLRACLRGPAVDGLQTEILAMLATVTWKR